MNGKALGRFKFTLKNDYKFNQCIIIDIIYFNKKPVLYIVNKATVFQATKFLKDINTKILKIYYGFIKLIYIRAPLILLLLI